MHVINLAYSLLSGVVFRELDGPEQLPLRDVVRRWQLASLGNIKNAKRLNDATLPIPRQFLGILNRAFSIEVGVWKSQLEPWEAFIEPARQIWGEQVVFCLTAIFAAATVKSETGRECRLTDQGKSLCDRTACARQRSEDSEWWREQLASARVTEIIAVQFVILAMLQFIAIELIFKLSEEISGVLDCLLESAWHQLVLASPDYA
jgi:hypothetical protein